MNRTAFLIDGFNLYHSVKSASVDLGLGGQGTRWLDIRGLCASYLHAIGNNAQVCGMFYFSALATHIQAIDPQVVSRHQNYIRCLEGSGIAVELARFKKKNIKCPACATNIKRHEEKETDVAIAAKLLELLFLDQCDTAVLLTGDTDIVPAVKTAQRLFPNKSIGFILPFGRYNSELAKIGAFHFKVKSDTYPKHQLPDPFPLPNGKTVNKPAAW
jgi:uncharacterized LabA/DUF88 family protein